MEEEVVGAPGDTYGNRISTEVSVRLNAFDSPSTLITSSFSIAVSGSEFHPLYEYEHNIAISIINLREL